MSSKKELLTEKPTNIDQIKWDSDTMKPVVEEMRGLMASVGVILFQTQNLKEFILWLWPNLNFLQQNIRMVKALVDKFLPKIHSCIDPETSLLVEVDLHEIAVTNREYKGRKAASMPDELKRKVEKSRLFEPEIRLYRGKVVHIFSAWYPPVDDLKWRTALLIEGSQGLVTSETIMSLTKERAAAASLQKKKEDDEAAAVQKKIEDDEAEAKKKEDDEAESKRLEAKKKQDEEDDRVAEAKREEEVKRKEDIWKCNIISFDQLLLVMEELLESIFMRDLVKTKDTSSDNENNITSSLSDNAHDRQTRQTRKKSIVGEDYILRTVNATNDHEEKKIIQNSLDKVKNALKNKDPDATKCIEFNKNPQNNMSMFPSQDSLGTSLYGGGDLHMQKQCFLDVVTAVENFVKKKEKVYK